MREYEGIPVVSAVQLYLDLKGFKGRGEEAAQVVYETAVGYPGIALGFCEAVPEALVYRYMVEEVIPHEEVFPQNGEGFTTTLDGCTSGCDECFQKAYCETGSNPHCS